MRQMLTREGRESMRVEHGWHGSTESTKVCYDFGTLDSFLGGAMIDFSRPGVACRIAEDCAVTQQAIVRTPRKQYLPHFH